MAETNEKFFELPEEKQLRIINAGLEVFSKSEYKKASTDDIASKAGISKGLLFYYFHDKKTLYMFLFENAANRIKAYVVDSRIGEITDFFELCAYAAERKCQMLHQSPYIMDFIVRAFYSEGEAISEDIKLRIRDETSRIFSTYFTNVDFSKFKPDVNPIDMYQMLTWLSDGYMHEKQQSGQLVTLDDMMEKYNLWTTYFKRMSYKEEHLS